MPSKCSNFKNVSLSIKFERHGVVRILIVTEKVESDEGEEINILGGLEEASSPSFNCSQ